MMVRVKLADKAEMKEKDMIGVEIKGQTILLARVGEEYLAMGGICSHAGGQLWLGKLNGHVVKCPRHGSEFDLRTGKLLKGPWIPFAKAKDLRAYPVVVEGEEILIDL